MITSKELCMFFAKVLHLLEKPLDEFKNSPLHTMIYGIYSYICSAFHFEQASQIANTSRWHFLCPAVSFCWRQQNGSSYSSDPRVVRLMAPLPVQGGMQRESGTFFFLIPVLKFWVSVPFPVYINRHNLVINQHIVSFLIAFRK